MNLEKRNFRDLSMYETNGKRLSRSMFFRSGKLYKLSPEELHTLEQYNIKTIIDFRTQAEINQKSDTPIPGAKTFVIPLVQSEMFGITHENHQKMKYRKPPVMEELYQTLLSSDSAVDGIAKTLQIIFDPTREGAILWHCTEGKDRAGIVTALFLYALGFDEETIFQDYEKTNLVTRRKGKRYRALIRTFMFRFKLADAVYKAMLAERPYLQAGFDTIKSQYGTIDNFISTRLGISEEMICKFKAKYFIDA